jgi:hypothetical protein
LRVYCIFGFGWSNRNAKKMNTSETIIWWCRR